MASLPATFCFVLWGWGTVDLIRARAEVNTFIAEHEHLVQTLMKHPKVHDFSLRQSPDHSGTLLIQFDVDDKETYELIESELDGIWHLIFPPNWDTNVRSNEDLGNNYGYAAWGLGMAFEGMMRMVIAAATAFVVLGILLWRLACRTALTGNVREFKPKQIAT